MNSYSIDKRYDPDRERADSKKVAFQYKKEMKGAIRELRKDAKFIAHHEMKERKEKDVAYKARMNKIMGDLAQQEGAMRGYERQQKRAKGKK